VVVILIVGIPVRRATPKVPSALTLPSTEILAKAAQYLQLNQLTLQDGMKIQKIQSLLHHLSVVIYRCICETCCRFFCGICRESHHRIIILANLQNKNQICRINPTAPPQCFIWHMKHWVSHIWSVKSNVNLAVKEIRSSTLCSVLKPVHKQVSK